MINLSGINEIKIKEQFKDHATGEHFRALGIPFDAPQGVSIHDFSFPYPTALLSVLMPTAGLNDGDSAEFVAAPKTTVGIITNNVAIGDTVINVQTTVLENTNIGDYLTLDDGTNSEEHICIDKDENAKTIKLDKGAVNAYTVSAPTYVKVTKKMGINIELCGNTKYEFGESKIGGSYIPANTIIRVIYTNVGTGTVRVRPVLELMY